ncbi:MAG TPA: M15 family metallopeptidase [Actinoplanes sp.]
MGIEKVNARIADIQSRMIAMQTQQTTRTVQNSGTSTTTSTSGQDFASYLQNAVGSAQTANKSYTLNAKGIPTDLAAYGNGRIPADALEKVGNTRHKLWAPAAQSLNQMIADAEKAGVKIGITDSYRPYDEQVDLARRKGLYSQGGLAAKPGTSEHGWGMATDLDLNNKAQAWMRANGEKYGFVENTPRESWHWAYKPKSV